LAVLNLITFIKQNGVVMIKHFCMWPLFEVDVVYVTCKWVRLKDSINKLIHIYLQLTIRLTQFGLKHYTLLVKNSLTECYPGTFD
jgi:hypothetical protein